MLDVIRTTVYLFIFFGTPHHLDFTLLGGGAWPQNPICSCSSLHLQTPSVFFCELQKGTRGPEVPTPDHSLGKKGHGQGGRVGGDRCVAVLVLCTRLELQGQATVLILRTHDDGSCFKRKIILQFTFIQNKLFPAEWNFEMLYGQLAIFKL